MLNQEGTPTRRGFTGRWRPQTIGNMLRNPVYAGQVRLNESIFTGEHAGILSAELFATTQGLIEERGKLAPRGRSSPHLLSGIVRCGTCGKRLTIHQTVRGVGKKLYLTYRHSPNYLRGEGACPGVDKSARRLEELVIGEVRRLAESPELRRATLEAAKREMGVRREPLAAEREEILAQLAEGEKAFDRWADRLARGVIDEDQFARLNGAHLEAKRRQRERLAEIDAVAAEEENLEVTVAEVEQVLADFGRTWEGLSGDERREVLRSLVEYLKVYPDHAELKLIFRPATRLDLSFAPSRRTPVQ